MKKPVFYLLAVLVYGVAGLFIVPLWADYFKADFFEGFAWLVGLLVAVVLYAILAIPVCMVIANLSWRLLGRSPPPASVDAAAPAPEERKANK